MRRRRRFGICYPGYRYCGPGCSGPGRPVNAVDECCRQHDQCYEMGFSKRYCDELFHYCLAPYMDPYSKMGRHAKLFSNMIKLKNIF